MGQFLSETAVLTRGQNLYRDIFETKDPLFFLSSTLSTLLIGRSGPYIMDAVAVAIAAPVAYLAFRSLKIDQFKSAVGGVLFVGGLSGVYFQSFRTGTVCLVLVLMSIITVNKNNLFFTGVIFALVLGYKMAYIPFLVCPFVLGFPYFKSGRNVFRIVLGFLMTILLMFGAMQIRGEFVPYIEMIRTNFEYRRVYPAIVGFRSGLGGHLDAVNGNGSSANFLILTVLCSWILVAISKCCKSWHIIIGLVLMQLSVLFVVFTTAMWVHHLQMLCLLGFATYALICSSSTSSFQRHPYQRLLGVLLIAVTFQAAGFRIPLKMHTALTGVIHPEWIIPAEASYVKQHFGSSSKSVNFARFGPNDDLGLVSFLPQKWKLVCPDYAQSGLEDVKWISKITNCMADYPEVVFVSPGFFSLSRPIGEYELLKTEARKVLNIHFICIELVERSGAELCQRKIS